MQSCTAWRCARCQIGIGVQVFRCTKLQIPLRVPIVFVVVDQLKRHCCMHACVRVCMHADVGIELRHVAALEETVHNLTSRDNRYENTERWQQERTMPHYHSLETHHKCGNTQRDLSQLQNRYFCRWCCSCCRCPLPLPILLPSVLLLRLWLLLSPPLLTPSPLLCRSPFQCRPQPRQTSEGSRGGYFGYACPDATSGWTTACIADTDSAPCRVRSACVWPRWYSS